SIRIVTRSPCDTQRVSTTLPVSTISPRLSSLPRAASEFASQASAAKGWPMTSLPWLLLISLLLIDVVPESVGRSSRRQFSTGGAGMVDVEEALHHRRRAADLPADAGPLPGRRQQIVRRCLHRIGGRFVRWPAVDRQRADLAACESRRRQQPRRLPARRHGWRAAPSKTASTLTALIPSASTA